MISCGNKEINKSYIFSDFNDFSEITEETRLKNSSRIFTGGVRINNNMYRTEKETDDYISKSLARKLP